MTEEHHAPREDPLPQSLLALTLTTPLLAGGLASCGGSSGPGSAPEGGASIWILTGQPGEGIRQDSIDAFNEANPDTRLASSAFVGDAFKTKIRTALGADQAPTIIWTWGGGGLRDYVDSGQVDDLTDSFASDPALRDSILSSAFGAATVEDRIYAVPCEGVTPIVLYYNTELFAQVGAQPPTTWDEPTALVPVFLDAGLAPISLAGQSRWTSMMWLELLFDRIGGPEVFGAVSARTPGAWSAPAAIDALTRLQDLVRAGGFIEGFQSVSADGNADIALVHTGKAAMVLHGAWNYGAFRTDAPDFVERGALGFGAFPAVDGGTGDVADAVGNPASYYALSSSASEEEKAAARAYFTDGLNTDATTAAWIAAGTVPVINGSDSGFAGSPSADFLQFVYDMASGAPHFEQSWDQALSGGEAETLLNTIEQLFGLDITPQEFADTMNSAMER